MDYDVFSWYASRTFGFSLLGVVVFMGLALLIIHLVGDSPVGIIKRISGISVVTFVALAFIAAGIAFLITFVFAGSPI